MIVMLNKVQQNKGKLIDIKKVVNQGQVKMVDNLLIIEDIKQVR